MAVKRTIRNRDWILVNTKRCRIGEQIASFSDRVLAQIEYYFQMSRSPARAGYLLTNMDIAAIAIAEVIRLYVIAALRAKVSHRNPKRILLTKNVLPTTTL